MDNTFGMNIIPENDSQRIEALKRYKILNTPSEKSFDHIARLATQIFKVPISLMSLVDEEQVYFKANVGMGSAKNTSRGLSLCSLSVLDPEVTVFENAPEEPCLLTNPNVAGEFGLKFYAGAPITTYDGFLIGTLCVIDKTPRIFTADDREILKGLAKVVMDEIELRLSSINEVEKQQSYIEETAAINEELLHSNEELLSSQLNLKSSLREIEELNDELAAINEEITATNEELLTTNIELKETHEHLLVSNMKLADSEELKNIAIEQAKLGIWYIDAVTREFVPSGRLKEFFGYYANEEMSYNDAVNQIRQDYREEVVKEVDLAVATGRSYDLEYPIIGFRNEQMRWVRATGRLNAAVNGRDSYFSGTVMDITEQKEDDQRKNDFISMVSHELKTPLTSMNGYIQMLAIKAGKNNDTFTVSVLERANKQTKKMTTMINGFLNMKRLETGKIPLSKSVFDMAGLIKETEEESIATISSHRVIFAPVETTFLEADRDKIGQVINNLISNAVKYSPQGSDIHVACINVGATVQVSVKDQGMGISKSDQVKLFDRFYRVESKEMNSISGFGIGLYLCDEIIRRHEGKIWVESELNVGSTFFFNLPFNL